MKPQSGSEEELLRHLGIMQAHLEATCLVFELVSRVRALVTFSRFKSGVGTTNIRKVLKNYTYDSTAVREAPNFHQHPTARLTGNRRSQVTDGHR